MINRGVIYESRESDLIAGTIPFEERNPSGDWTSYLPPGELQYSMHGDSMACVTFSALNVLEAQIKFLTGESIDHSDRFTAKMSKTTPQGNTLQNVWNSIRNDGVVLESEWPQPKDFDWNTFYAEIPQEVKNRAFKYDIAYEWMPTTREAMLQQLKQSPVHLILPGHAVMGFFCDQDVEDYFDTYNPFQKSTTYANIQYAMKAVLTLNSSNMFDLRQVEGSTEVWLIRNGKKTHVYNQGALLTISDFSQVKPITQAELDAIPDSGLDLAVLIKE